MYMTNIRTHPPYFLSAYPHMCVCFADVLRTFVLGATKVRNDKTTAQVHELCKFF